MLHRLVPLAAVALAGSLLMTGCSESTPVVAGSTASLAASEVASAAGDTPSASTTDAAASPSSTPTHTPLPNPVQTPVAKVNRGGAAKPSVTASTSSFDRVVSYPDGVTLTITAVQKGVETSQGPGAFPGREYVAFDLSLKNGSTKAIDVNQVVLTAFYGKTRQKADPVYAPETKAADFNGTAAPGATTKARYAFALPTSALNSVTLVVDFDALHTSALFQGTVVPR